MGINKRRVKVTEMEVIMIRRKWYQFFRIGWYRFTDSWNRKWFIKLNE